MSMLEKDPTRRPVLDTGKESNVQQSFKNETDINVIMKKYKSTGQLPQMVRRGNFMDCTHLEGYQESLNIVKEAHNLFMALPSNIRKRFGNDPQEYIDFASNPDNAEELVKLGLAVKKPVPTPSDDKAET